VQRAGYAGSANKDLDTAIEANLHAAAANKTDYEECLACQ